MYPHTVLLPMHNLLFSCSIQMTSFFMTDALLVKYGGIPGKLYYVL